MYMHNSIHTYTWHCVWFHLAVQASSRYDTRFFCHIYPFSRYMYYACNCLPNFSQSCSNTSLLPIVATAWTNTSPVGSTQLLNHHSNTEVRHRCEWSGNWAWLLWMMSSWCWGTWSLVPKVFHSAASGSEHRKARLVGDPSRTEEQHG